MFQPELVLRALDLCYTDAIVQLELKTCTLRTMLQSCVIRAGAQNLYFVSYTCTSKLRSSSQSWKLVLHVLYLRYKVVTFQLVRLRALDLYFKVAILQLEMVLQSCDFPARAGNLYFAYQTCATESQFCTSRTRLVLQSCDVPARASCTSRTRVVLQSRDFPARNLYFAYKTCTTKSRFSSWSRKPVLRVLDLYYKVAIFQLELEACTSRVRLVLQSCDFRAGAGNLYFVH